MSMITELKRASLPETRDLDHLSQYFINALPSMDTDEQKLALGLYALLAEGQPVAIEQLSGYVDISVTKIKAVLDDWIGVFYDDQNHVIGFWGIAINEMNHRFEVNGKTAYTWCAWDSLFIPELLKARANVTSHCAATAKEIKLTISPDGICACSSEDIMVSFLIPDEHELNENITASFCHFVHFFSSRDAGKQWVADHEGTFLLSLNDAFTVGKKMNAVRYKQMLAT